MSFRATFESAAQERQLSQNSEYGSLHVFILFSFQDRMEAAEQCRKQASISHTVSETSIAWDTLMKGYVF